MSKLSRLLNRLGLKKQPSSEEETEVSLTVDANQENEEPKIINHGCCNKEKEITMKEEENNANSSEEQKATKDKARIYNLIIVDESGSMRDRKRHV